ncbi:hypothetical protein GY26_15710 [Gammaproteobacteria bacterium MFB021]|nr:hypothetical protein GY26_15710 [Gammaproteobacteria bacterium MFB021]
MNVATFAAPPDSAVVSADCLNLADLDAGGINATAEPINAAAASHPRRGVMSMAACRCGGEAVDGTELTTAGRNLS